MVKETRILMGMPITIQIDDESANSSILEKVFNYFSSVEEKFSVFKENSEISKINRGEIAEKDFSEIMKEVFELSKKTKEETNGYFDIKTPDGKINPSGLVKGWAIYNAAEIIFKSGFKEFFVDAGGDIEARGKIWKVGIKNPLNQNEIVKVVNIKDGGIATSGTYERGKHIYNPKNGQSSNEILSITVIGPNVYEADRFATPAFAMGEKGVEFIESLQGFEAYMINKDAVATMTSGFEKFL